LNDRRPRRRDGKYPSSLLVLRFLLSFVPLSNTNLVIFSPQVDRNAGVHTIKVPGRYGWRDDPNRDEGAGAKDRRKEQHAVRAGTRGFRAPEVLLGASTQSSAIDVWSSGVVMLSILSGTSLFFLSARDFDGLLEIASLFGSQRVQKLAKFYGKDCTLGKDMEFPAGGIDGADEASGTPAELRDRCRVQFPEHPAHSTMPMAGYDLLSQLLMIEPHKRYTAAAALEHPFFKSAKLSLKFGENSRKSRS